LPALLLGLALEMPGRARQVVEDHVRLEDRQPPVAQRRHHAPPVDRQVFRLLLLADLEVDRAKRKRHPGERQVQHRLVAGAGGEAAVKGQAFGVHQCSRSLTSLMTRESRSIVWRSSPASATSIARRAAAGWVLTACPAAVKAVISRFSATASSPVGPNAAIAVVVELRGLPISSWKVGTPGRRGLR